MALSRFPITMSRMNTIVDSERTTSKLTLPAMPTARRCQVFSIRNHADSFMAGNTKYPRRYQLMGDEFPEHIRELFAVRAIRYSPKVNRFIDRIRVDDNEGAHDELDADYEQFGRREAEAIIIARAEFLKNNLQLLDGDFSIFPKEDSRPKTSRVELTIKNHDESANTKKQAGQPFGNGSNIG